MAKIKYYYDTKTLSYKRIELNTFDKFKRTLSFLFSSAVIGLIMVIIFFQFFDSPKEKKLNIHESIKFFLQVGSIDVKKYCDQKGYLKILKEMNIELLNPQCGACCNCGPGSSTKKEAVTISSINRNFPGRSGPGSVWLASPKTVVASAIAGKITSFEKLKQMYVK